MKTQPVLRKVLVVVHRGKGSSLRILVLRRSPPKAPEWHPVTGNVEPGEEVDAAAAREAWEETGIRGVPAPLGLVHRFEAPRRRAEMREFEEHAFALESPSDRVALSEEHDEFAWLAPVEALLRVVHEHQREAIRATVKRAA